MLKILTQKMQIETEGAERGSCDSPKPLPADPAFWLVPKAVKDAEALECTRTQERSRKPNYGRRSSTSSSASGNSGRPHAQRRPRACASLGCRAPESLRSLFPPSSSPHFRCFPATAVNGARSGPRDRRKRPLRATSGRLLRPVLVGDREAAEDVASGCSHGDAAAARR